MVERATSPTRLRILMRHAEGPAFRGADPLCHLPCVRNCQDLLHWQVMRALSLLPGEPLTRVTEPIRARAMPAGSARLPMVAALGNSVWASQQADTGDEYVGGRGAEMSSMPSSESVP